jgi:hypothetical protein
MIIFSICFLYSDMEDPADFYSCVYCPEKVTLNQNIEPLYDTAVPDTMHVMKSSSLHILQSGLGHIKADAWRCLAKHNDERIRINPDEEIFFDSRIYKIF